MEAQTRLPSSLRMSSGVNWRKKSNHVFATLTICHYNVRFHRYADDTQVYISNEPTAIARFSRWVKDRVDLTTRPYLSGTDARIGDILSPFSQTWYLNSRMHRCSDHITVFITFQHWPQTAPPCSHLSDLLLECTSSHSLRSAGLLSVPISRLSTTGARAFSCNAPWLWNPPTCLQLPTFSCQFCPCCAFAVLFLVFWSIFHLLCDLECPGRHPQNKTLHCYHRLPIKSSRCGFKFRFNLSTNVHTLIV